MKNTTLVFILLALLGFGCCGIGAVGVGVYYLMPIPSAASQVPTIPVAVAALDLPAGTTLDDPATQLVLKPFLAVTVPPGALSNLADLQGKTLARTIERGAPVTVGDLRPAEPLFKPLPPGLKFMTIRITGTQNREAGELPGNCVAISVSFPDPNDPDRILTESVVEKAFVVAANTRGGETPPPGTPDYITVGVQPDQLEALTAAKNKGKLNVTWRPNQPTD